MEELEIYIYFCQNCEEEVSTIGLKKTCPYCKSGAPQFTRVEDIIY